VLNVFYHINLTFGDNHIYITQHPGNNTVVILSMRWIT